ncbi:hypothetical protein [Lactococcus termiticola]|uniref:Uncharacterized protein n=1 Tax=Lactococcus termiticola TaxID=2169526 RepID=A0A2R5HHX5_9LACT|nr:hypothetical protein [Lactococcus termiticola]GBG97005.1 hypothetical protein NtB2_01142 [Lactococcus termiticola]
MVTNVMDWIASLPLWQASLIIFVAVACRAQSTYWIGRAIQAGLLKTKWGQKRAESAEKSGGVTAIERFGLPIIPLSFLTVGFQTLVQLGAGLIGLSWLRYSLAALPGYIAYGIIYAAGGLSLFRALATGSIGLLILFIIIVLVLMIAGHILMRYIKRENS